MVRVGAQKGMSLIGLLIILAVVGFVASVAFRTVPHYLDYMAMKKLADATAQPERVASLESEQQLRTYFEHGMQVNNIRDIDLKKALTVREGGNTLLARLNYEQREPLVGNIDLVMKFDHEFSVSQP